MDTIFTPEIDEFLKSLGWWLPTLFILASYYIMAVMMLIENWKKNKKK